MASNLNPPPDEASADCQVDDAILRVVSCNIGKKWKQLCQLLLIPDSKLHGVSLQHQSLGEGEVAFQILRMWREDNPTNATMSVLTAQLEQVGKLDLVNQIMKMVQNQRSTNQAAQLPASEADRQVDDAILRVVSREIGLQWKELGRLLLVPDSRLDDFFKQYQKQGEDKMAYQTFVAWREAASTNATMAVLTAQLKEIGRQDIANKIGKMSENPRNGGAGQSVPPEQQSEAEWLKQLRHRFHDKYQKYAMKDLPIMGNIFITLAEHYVDLSVQTADSNQKTTEDSSEEEESADTEEVFKSAFSASKHPVRILVEGPPGYGKTTLSAKLCFDHTTSENYINNFDLVLHFSLSCFEGNLDEMFYTAADLTDFLEREMFLKIIHNPSNRILIVLDGLDEVPKQHLKSLLSLLEGRQFPHMAVVVTSKPGQFTFENLEEESNGYAEHNGVFVDWSRIWQRRINILGINKRRQEIFIAKHLAGVPENILSDVLIQLKDVLIQLKKLESDFLKCPLILRTIMLCLTDKHRGDIITPYGLCKSVLNCLIYHYCSKQKEPINKKIDLFTVIEAPKPFYVDLLCQFGEFAFWALTEKKLSFYRDEILGNNPQRDPRILELGLLTQSVSKVGLVNKVIYEPIHKSLFEVSAAYALWMQSTDSDRDLWVEKVIRLWRCENGTTPFCLPMLAGLMQHRIDALLDALKPYASVSVWVNWLRYSFSEIELTESVLSSATPFLPVQWQQRYEDCFSKTQHDALLIHGIRAGRIKHVELSRFLDTPMPDGVVVDTAVFRNTKGSIKNVHKFSCYRLVFRDSDEDDSDEDDSDEDDSDEEDSDSVDSDEEDLDNEDSDKEDSDKEDSEQDDSDKDNSDKDDSDKDDSDEDNTDSFHSLKTFVLNSSTINFQTLSFIFTSNTSRKLHLLCNAITTGTLKDIQIQITCGIEENEEEEILLLLTELITKEKLNALRITIPWFLLSLTRSSLGQSETLMSQKSLAFQELLNTLLVAAGNSSQLTSLLLMDLRGVSVDLDHLCGGVKKTWEFLGIERGSIIEFTPQIDQTFQIKCLELDCLDIPETSFRFLEVCQVTSLWCNLSLLSNLENLKLLHEHLTELNVIVDKTIVTANQSPLTHFPNLNILVLTMTQDYKYPSFPVRDFLFGSSHFLRLKGIEIWNASENRILSLEFMKCISDFSKASIPNPSTSGGKDASSFHSLQLEYFLLHSGEDDDFSDYLPVIKTNLINKSLSRVDVVLEPKPDVRSPPFSECSMESSSSPDFLQKMIFHSFSPEDGFRVENDLWGIRPEDTILSKMQYDSQYGLFLGAVQV